MRPTEEHAVLRGGLRTLQIILVALLVGVVVFSGIVLIAITSVEPPPDDQPRQQLLTPILVGLSFAVAGTLWIVANVMLSQARQRIADGTWKPGLRKRVQEGEAVGTLSPQAFEEAGNAGRLFQAWMSSTIVRSAGLEAAAFLNLVAAMVERSPIPLVVAGFWALLLAFQVPTSSRLDHWLESELLRVRAPDPDPDAHVT